MHGRRYFHGPPRVDTSSVAPYNWNNYDPRVDDFFHESNRYRTGPGAFLPPEQQLYSIRSNSLLPFRVFIKGIHPHTTEDGIAHVMSNYGNPLLIERKRSRFNEVIAFVEYRTQREAENAIISLDNKPPLNWRVSFAYSSRGEDRFLDNLEDLTIEAELESQQLLFPSTNVPARALPSAATQLPVSAGPIPLPPSAEDSNFPPCTACGRSASLVCTICKTRYCSPRCQSGDWPNHRRVCAPPPPLELAGPMKSPAAAKTKGPENSATVPFVHQAVALPAPAPSAPVRNQPKKASNDDAHAFVIKGIHPLDNPKTSNQVAHDKAPVSEAFGSKIISPTFGELDIKDSSQVPIVLSTNSPDKPKSPLQPRVSILAAQASPLSSTTGSHIPTPLPDVKYAKAYAKASTPFPGNEKHHRVLVCFAISPEEFYVQHTSLRDALLRLSAELQESAITCDGIAEPVEWAPCAAYYEDGAWYRALILKVFPGSQTEIGVRFIDYGNTSKMPNIPENFRMLEAKFAKLPPIGVRVKLADVLPPNGTTWEPYVNEAFNQLVTEKEFMLEIIRTEGTVLTVRLKNRAGLDLGEELIKRGLAKGLMRENISNDLDPMATTLPGSSLLPPPPQVNLRQPLSAKAGSPREPNTGPHRLPNKVTPPRKPNDQNKAAQPDTPTHKPVQPRPASPEREPSASQTASSNKMEVVATETKVLPTPLPLSNQSEFVKKKINSVLTALTQGAEATLIVVEARENYLIGTLVHDKYLAVLDFHDCVAASPIVDKFLPPVGTVVAAFSEELQNWFRGYVMEEREGTYDILYVDYGNVECGVQKVKPLPLDYDHPELAVKLILPESLPKSVVEQSMQVNSTHSISITEVRGNGSVCTLTNVDGIAAKLEPWTSLVPSEIALPLWEQGLMTNVLVFLADDVDKVFVQTTEVAESLSVIEQELKSYLQKFSTIPPLKTPPKVGSYVVAIFPDDGALYRAKIVSSQDGNVTVEFIDYGNVCSVSLDAVRPLPEELYSFPTCGRFVSLSRVVRPSGPLPPTVKAVLDKCIGQPCQMVVESIVEDCPHVVITTEDGCVINAQASEALQAAEPAPVMPALAPASPEKVENVPVDNSLGEFNYEDGPFPKLPEQGALDVLVLTSDDPRTIMFCVADEDHLEKLAQLQEEIQAYADSIMRGHSPEVNEICLARSDDGFWYRAACLEVAQQGDGAMYVCIQVDFGKMLYADVNKVRRIPKRFVTALPYLAIQGVLKEAAELFETTAPVNEKTSKRLQELLPALTPAKVNVVRCQGGAYIIEIPEIGEKLVSEGLL